MATVRGGWQLRGAVRLAGGSANATGAESTEPATDALGVVTAGPRYGHRYCVGMPATRQRSDQH